MIPLLVFDIDEEREYLWLVRPEKISAIHFAGKITFPDSEGEEMERALVYVVGVFESESDENGMLHSPAMALCVRDPGSLAVLRGLEGNYGGHLK
jgi:hypothetical protein